MPLFFILYFFIIINFCIRNLWMNLRNRVTVNSKFIMALLWNWKKKVQLAKKKTVKIKSFYDLHFHVRQNNKPYFNLKHFCCRIFDFYPIFHFQFLISITISQIFKERKKKSNKETNHFFCSQFTPHDILL